MPPLDVGFDPTAIDTPPVESEGPPPPPPGVAPAKPPVIPSDAPIYVGGQATIGARPPPAPARPEEAPAAAPAAKPPEIDPNQPIHITGWTKENPYIPTGLGNTDEELKEFSRNAPPGSYVRLESKEHPGTYRMAQTVGPSHGTDLRTGKQIEFPTGFYGPTESTEPPSGFESAKAGAKLGAIPALGGAIGAGLGAGVGAWAFGAGAIPGAIAGGMAGATIASKAQDWVISQMPESLKESLGISEKQQTAAREAHPYWYQAGEAVPNFIFFTPGALRQVAPEGASAIAKMIIEKPGATQSIAAGINGAISVVSQASQGQPIDPGAVALASGIGFLTGHSTKWGRKAFEMGIDWSPMRRAHPAAAAATAADGAAAPPGALPSPPLTPGERYTPPEGMDEATAARVRSMINHAEHPDANPNEADNARSMADELHARFAGAPLDWAALRAEPAAAPGAEAPPRAPGDMPPAPPGTEEPPAAAAPTPPGTPPPRPPGGAPSGEAIVTPPPPRGAAPTEEAAAPRDLFDLGDIAKTEEKGAPKEEVTEEEEAAKATLQEQAKPPGAAEETPPEFAFTAPVLAKLKALGYTDAQIGALKPQEALRIIQEEIKAPPVEAAAQPDAVPASEFSDSAGSPISMGDTVTLTSDGGNINKATVTNLAKGRVGLTLTSGGRMSMGAAEIARRPDRLIVDAPAEAAVEEPPAAAVPPEPQAAAGGFKTAEQVLAETGIDPATASALANKTDESLREQLATLSGAQSARGAMIKRAIEAELAKRAETQQAAAAAQAEPTSVPAAAEPTAIRADELPAAMGAMGKGITEGFYQGVFDALQGQNKFVAQTEGKLLGQLKPFYDQGLIKSPEDVRSLANAEFDPVKAGLAEPAAGPTADEVVAAMPTTAEEAGGGEPAGAVGPAGEAGAVEPAVAGAEPAKRPVTAAEFKGITDRMYAAQAALTREQNSRNPDPARIERLTAAHDTAIAEYQNSEGPPVKASYVHGTGPYDPNLTSEQRNQRAAARQKAEQDSAAQHQAAVDQRIHDEGTDPVPEPKLAGQVFNIGGNRDKSVIRGTDAAGNQWLGNGNILVKGTVLERAYNAASKLKTTTQRGEGLAPDAISKVTTPDPKLPLAPVNWLRTVTDDTGKTMVIGTRQDGSYVALQKPIFDALNAAMPPGGELVGKAKAKGDDRMFVRNAAGDVVGVGMPINVDQAKAKLWTGDAGAASLAPTAAEGLPPAKPADIKAGRQAITKAFAEHGVDAANAAYSGLQQRFSSDSLKPVADHLANLVPKPPPQTDPHPQPTVDPTTAAVDPDAAARYKNAPTHELEALADALQDQPHMAAKLAAVHTELAGRGNPQTDVTRVDTNTGQTTTAPAQPRNPAAKKRGLAAFTRQQQMDQMVYMGTLGQNRPLFDWGNKYSQHIMLGAPDPGPGPAGYEPVKAKLDSILLKPGDPRANSYAQGAKPPEVIDTVNPQTNAPVSLVRIPYERGSPKFKELATQAVQLGGRYMASHQMPEGDGFIFNDRAAADRFHQAASGPFVEPSGRAAPPTGEPNPVDLQQRRFEDAQRMGIDKHLQAQAEAAGINPQVAKAFGTLVKGHYDQLAATFDGKIGSPEYLYAHDFPELLREIVGGPPGVGPAEPGTAGRVTFFKDGQRLMEIMGNHDASTPIHEAAHIFLEDRLRYAEHPDAPDWLKRDAEIIRDTFGIKQGEPISDASHEAFAKANEAWARSGVPPEGALGRAFQAFREWLQRIYSTAVGLGKPVSSELRGVLNRMWGADPIERVNRAAAERSRPTSKLEQDLRDAVMGDDQPRTFNQRARRDTQGGVDDELDTVFRDGARWWGPGGTKRFLNTLKALNAVPSLERRYWLNWFTSQMTTFLGMAARDPLSRAKAAAEKGRWEEAATLLRSYKGILPEGKTPEQWQRVFNFAEIASLTGARLDMDAATLRVVNGGTNSALHQVQHTPVGSAIELTNPEEVAMFKAIRRVLDASYADMAKAIAEQFEVPTQYGTHPRVLRGLAEENRAINPELAARLELASDALALFYYHRQQNYVPFMRFGDYFFRVKPIVPGDGRVNQWDGTGAKPTTYFGMIDARSGLEKFLGGVMENRTATINNELARLRQMFPEDQYQIEHGWMMDRNAFRNTVSDLSMPLIDRLMLLISSDAKGRFAKEFRESGLSPEDAAARAGQAYDDMLGILRREMRDARVAGFMKQRENIAGYSTDFLQSTQHYLNWAAHTTADLRWRPTIQAADLKIQTDHPDPLTQAWWRDWNRRKEDWDNPTAGPLNYAKRMAFNLLLGGNAATMVKILLHGPLRGIPMLGTAFGPGGRAAAVPAWIGALGQAMGSMRGDLQRGMFIDLEHLATSFERSDPALAAGLRAAIADGTLHSHAFEEMSAVLRSGTESALTPRANLLRRIETIWGSTVASMDQAVRAAMFISAHKMAQRYGMEGINRVWGRDQLWDGMSAAQKNSIEFAKFMVNKTVGISGALNSVPLFRSQLGQVMFQFHNYEAGLISNLNQAMWRLGPEGKATAGLMLAAMGSLGGLAALPFFTDITGAADFIGKQIDKSFPGIDEYVRDLAEAIAPGWSETIQHGPDLGVDLSGIGFGDIIGREFRSPISILGAVPSLIVGTAERAGERISSGQATDQNYYRAAWVEALPNGIKHPMQYMYPELTDLTAKGGTPLRPIRDPGELAKVLAGFQPRSRAQERWQTEREFKTEASYRSYISGKENEIANLLHAGNQDAAMSAMAAAHEQIGKGIEAGVLKPSIASMMRSQINKKVAERMMPGMGSATQQRMRAVDMMRYPGAVRSTNPFALSSP